MRKLLSANFSRLRKDNVFRIALLGVLAASVLTMLNGARSADVMTEMGFVRSLDDYYFSLAPYMGMVYAAFISLFLGTEYSDGTMRNKLVVGHTRAQVYLANFLVCFAACLIFTAAWLIGGTPGLILIGPFEMGLAELLAYLLVAIGFTASFTALFTWISTGSTNKAMTLLFTLVIWTGLIMIASGFNDRLNTPEMESGVVLINGELVTTVPAPNPLYIGGTIREICEIILDFLPSGQTLLMYDTAIEHPVRQILFSVLFTTVAISVGIVTFRRKDLK